MRSIWYNTAMIRVTALCSLYRAYFQSCGWRYINYYSFLPCGHDLSQHVTSQVYRNTFEKDMLALKLQCSVWATLFFWEVTRSSWPVYLNEPTVHVGITYIFLQFVAMDIVGLRQANITCSFKYKLTPILCTTRVAGQDTHDIKWCAHVHLSTHLVR